MARQDGRGMPTVSCRSPMPWISSRPGDMTQKSLGAALAAMFLAMSTATLADAAKPLKIGKVTFHVAKFIGQDVTLVGYPLELPPATIYFSDEATGKIGPHDLAVTGPGL